MRTPCGDFECHVQEFLEFVPLGNRPDVKRLIEVWRAAGASLASTLAKVALSRKTDRNMRAAACWWLSQLSYGPATQVFLALIAEGDRELAFEAAKAIGSRPAGSVLRLCKILLQSRRSHARTAAAYALGILAFDTTVLNQRDEAVIVYQDRLLLRKKGP